MVDIHKDGVRASLASIFKSRKYSDVTVCSGDREFMVHRAIICPRSRFFEAACDGNFQESITKRIILEDDDPDSVERMLCYIYTLDYDDGSPSRPALVASSSKNANLADGADNNEEIQSSRGQAAADSDQDNASEISYNADHDQVIIEPGLLNNVSVYAIAEKYDIPQLKELARTKFLDRADRLLFTSKWEETIKAVYTSTPNTDRGLRDIVVRVCRTNTQKFLSSIALNGTTKCFGDLASDMLIETLRSNDQLLHDAEVQREEWEGRIRIEEEMRIRAELQLANAISISGRYDVCRHCEAEFSAQIDADEPSQLRCKKCRTRHR